MHEPPRWARLLLTWVLPSRDRSSAVLGDLREEYVRRAAGEAGGGDDVARHDDSGRRDVAVRRARRWYARAALSIAGRYAVEYARTRGRRRPSRGKKEGGGDRGVLAGLVYDGRRTVRSLARSPAFTLMAVLALSLGIGINAGIFAMVDGLAFRPLSADEPERLVALYGERRDRRLLRFSYPDWLDYRSGMDDVMEDLAGFVALPASLADDEGAVMVWTELVTANWFQVVRPKMEIGRPLMPDDEEAVVLSHVFWMRHFGGSPGALGRSITINGQPFTVVGVTGPHFSGTRLAGFAADAWMPVRTVERVHPGVPDRLESRSRRWLILVGRLEGGVSRERAQASANAVATALGQSFPASHSERRVRVISNRRPENEAGFGGGSAEEMRFGGLVAMGAVALILLVACANVASLQLARGLGRRRDVAVRMSLGASRSRVIGQAVVESVFLALAAGVIGIGLARLIVWAGGLFAPPLEFRVVIPAAVEWRVVVFTLVASGLAGVVAAALPAWRESRADPAASMKSVAGGSPRSPRLLDGLVVAQVAVSFILLIGAGLFVESLEARRSVDLGFPRESGLMMTMDPSLGGAGPEDVRDFYRKLLGELRALPGVRHAARATSFPLSGTRPPMVTVAIEDEASRERAVRSIWYAVEPGWFEAVGSPVVEGRDLAPRDSAGVPPVVVVNRTLARRLYPGEEALGRRVRVAGSLTAEIVGIVPDVKLINVTDDAQPFLARSLPQTSAGDRSTVVVRTVGAPDALLPEVRRTVSTLDPEVAVIGPKTLEEGTAIATEGAEAFATAAGVFALLAMLLSIAGIYGLVAHSVERRMREIGVRMALGGHAHLVVRLVLRRGVRLVLIGAVVGATAALALSSLIRRIVWGVSPTDPLVYVAVTVVVLGIGALASWIPARRIAGVDPVEVLRAD